MATYYFRNTGDSNWGTASNWSLTDGGGATGAVPTSSDDAYFTVNSGNCVVNASNRVCKTLIFAGVGAGDYSGTFTFTFNVSVGGSVTLSSTMTLAGSGTLNLVGVNVITVLTSNGKQFDRPLATNINGTGSGNITFADNWRVTNYSANFVGGNPLVFTGTTGTCEVTGNFTNNQVTSGSPKFKITGSASTISGTANCSADMIIDTSGNTVTVTNWLLTNGTLTYSSGTINHTGTITVASGAALSLNLQNQQFNNYTQNNGATVTLISDANFNNLTLGIAGAGTSCIINGSGFRLKARGNLAINQTSAGVTGTVIISCIGTGNISMGNVASSLNTDLEINTSGTYTLTSNIILGGSGKSLVRTAGSFNPSIFTITLGVGSATYTISCGGITFYNITVVAGAIITLNSDLNISNNLTLNGGVTFNGTNGWVCGNLLCSTTNTTITLQALNIYTTNTLANLLATDALRINMVSSSLTDRAIWTLRQGATQSMVYINGTRIDSSGGQTIWTFGGTLNNTINWNVGTKTRPAAWTFVN